MRSIATESARIPDQPSLPPTALGVFLLELYFTRVYNAHILFHKPILFQQYLEQELHGCLLRALLTLPTLYVAAHATVVFLLEISANMISYDFSNPMFRTMKKTLLMGIRN